LKSLSRSLIAGSAISIAIAAWNGVAAQAESLGYQCRAAVRAEMKGPDCRMPIPPNATSHCNIPSNAEIEVMDNKVNECVKRGGPGRQAKIRS
jgi:hypothetical protein